MDTGNSFTRKKVAVIAGFALLAAGIFTLWLFTSRCPSCKRFAALKTIKVEELSSRTERKREYKNNRWVERYVRVNSVRITKKCKYCGRFTTKFEDRTN